MPEESVKVAVRVRPFNQRELDRKAQLIIRMDGNMTTITNPDNKKDAPKKFTFDFSYWSHDGYTTCDDGVLSPDTSSSRYASQQTVYDDLGKGVLDNAFEGYNCSLFAYGQTGSGKSYSLIGYGKNKGIVPITCDQLFKTISENTDPNKRYEVTFSMLEIYNEQVRDLLGKVEDQGKKGLQVRQHPQHGSFYVQGLKHVPVGSYEEIDKRMQQGTAHRTVASTNMNATSSRAHTLVTVTFDQYTGEGKSESKKGSVMNLVDLAGSERADSTGATGDRLKEGANINKSLSALGNVISALADISSGSKKKIVVPYRDSVLTKLLQNALGGNSKTIMIAALSPADINYDETLSTLRYADRAKRIKNKTTVNEDPVERLIRQLKEENEQLKEQIKSGMFGGQIEITKEMSSAEVEKMRKEMMEEAMEKLQKNQEALMGNSQKAWSQKLQEARKEGLQSVDDERRRKEVHLVNLNEDMMLTGVVFHYLREGVTSIGRKDAIPLPSICLSGLSILKHHADIEAKKGKNGVVYEVRPCKGARIKINGENVSDDTAINHKDRILFGSNHLYIFVDPKLSKYNEKLATWEQAQLEIAQAQGFTASDVTALSKDKQITQEQVLETLPMVSEVNALSEEMAKYKTFDVVLLATDAYEGLKDRPTKVMIQVKDLLTKNVWLWERGKFINRRFIMQDMYQSVLDGELDLEKVPKEEDPFWDSIEDALVGNSHIFLQALSYQLEFQDQLPIRNFRGGEEGSMTVHLQPCTASGKNLGEDDYVPEPSMLLKKPFHFKVIVRGVELINGRHRHGVYVKYNVKGEKEVTTNIAENANKLHHSTIISFPAITDHHITFFDNASITFFVYAVQKDIPPDPKLAMLSTKDLRQIAKDEEMMEKRRNERRKSMFVGSEVPASQLKGELLLLQRKCQRLEMKEKKLQEVCRVWKKKFKPDEEKENGGKKVKNEHSDAVKFYHEVNSLAFSNGMRLKAKAQLISQMISGNKNMKNKLESLKESEENGEDDEDIDVYVFGDEEKKMRQKGGYVDGKEVLDYYGKQVKHLIESKKNEQRRKSLISGSPKTKKKSKNHKKNVEVTRKDESAEMSSACNLQ